MGVLDRFRSEKSSELVRTRGALVASAQRIRIDDRSEVERLARRLERWQPTVWNYYHLVPEMKYGVNKLADACSKVRLVPAVQDDPEEDPVPIDEAEDITDAEIAAAFDALRRLAYPVGHAENMRRLTVAFSVPGECYLVGIANDPTAGGERWEIRSSDDVKTSSGTVVLIDGPDSTDWRPLGPDDLIVRLWVPDVRQAWRPDSPSRGVMSVCEELLILDRSARAAERSRNNAGILTVPEELVPGPPDPTADPEDDPFYEKLFESMTTPVQDEGSASAVMPHVIYGKGEWLHPDFLRHIPLSRTLDENHDQRTERMLRRLASGINMPAEVILGMEDVNHWTAWQIEESTFKAHVEPVLIMAVASLTTGYFRPMVSEYEGVRPETVRRLVTWYDASKLVARPNRAQDAKDLYEQGVIGPQSLRDATDFDDTDAPTPQEKAEMVAWKTAGRPTLEVGGDRQKAPDPKPEPDDSEKGPPAEGEPAAPENDTRTGSLAAFELTPSTDGERDGVIVGLLPTPDEAQAIARDGGDPPERLHVTLAFLGKVADLQEGDVDKITAAAEASASSSTELAGTVSGVGHFTTAPNESGQVPCVALIDAQGVGGLRSTVMGQLAGAGIESPSEHDFTPHLTLGYHGPDEHDPSADEVAGLPVTFSDVVVRVGEEETRYPLTGDAVTADGWSGWNVHDNTASAATSSKAARIGERQQAIDRQLRDRLAGAFDQAMRRALERAGARLVQKVKASKDQRLRELVANATKLEVAGKLGPHLVVTLGLDPAALLDGAFDELEPRFDRWTQAAQDGALDLVPNMSRGQRALADTTFELDRRDAWAWVRQALTDRAAALLYDPNPAPPEAGEFDPTSMVPYGIVREATARAGGALHEPIARTAAGVVDRLRFVLGVATGWFVRRHLHEHKIITRGYVWEYGPYPRKDPFEPHEALDGLEFSNFDDAVLANREGFPPEAFFLPGDHDGCACDFRPLTEQA